MSLRACRGSLDTEGWSTCDYLIVTGARRSLVQRDCAAEARDFATSVRSSIDSQSGKYISEIYYIARVEVPQVIIDVVGRTFPHYRGDYGNAHVLQYLFLTADRSSSTSRAFSSAPKPPGAGDVPYVASTCIEPTSSRAALIPCARMDETGGRADSCGWARASDWDPRTLYYFATGFEPIS
ncbi:hypothetical protein SCHPADRAFT_71682 [Schizopora paradoxa]|uniref:Uncharacterized protein n=1 Tax=Schizopora paradoxa TaxID=27342 RepID=A0A0H2S545_9AGAM|nr:hypothetical protein SCHPADRAFT_71682 [Schizopora paradoxa]